MHCRLLWHNYLWVQRSWKGKWAACIHAWCNVELFTCLLNWEQRAERPRCWQSTYQQPPTRSCTIMCKHNWLQFLNKYQSFICKSRNAITFISVSLEDEDAVALTAAAAEYYQRYLAHFQQDPTKWVDQHVVSEHIEVSVREAAAFFTLSIRNSAHDSNAHNTSIQHSTWQINTTHTIHQYNTLHDRSIQRTQYINTTLYMTDQYNIVTHH